MKIPELRKPLPMDAKFTIPAGGGEDISVYVTAKAGASPDRGDPPVLVARAEWSGVLDGEDPFDTAFSVTTFNARNASPRLQVYRDELGHARVALDSAIGGIHGFTEPQISDWVQSVSDIGGYLAEIAETVWPGVAKVPQSGLAAGYVDSATIEVAELEDLTDALTEIAHLEAPSDDATPITAERIAELLIGDGAADAVQGDTDGSCGFTFHWYGYTIVVRVIHGLLVVDTGISIGALDGTGLERMVTSVAASNQNINGNTAALVNLGSREEPEWGVRSMLARPASPMADTQLELTVMNAAAMVSKVVADLLGRPAPGLE